MNEIIVKKEHSIHCRNLDKNYYKNISAYVDKFYINKIYNTGQVIKIKNINILEMIIFEQYCNCILEISFISRPIFKKYRLYTFPINIDKDCQNNLYKTNKNFNSILILTLYNYCKIYVHGCCYNLKTKQSTFEKCNCILTNRITVFFIEYIIDENKDFVFYKAKHICHN
jgi:hypothetical protein